VCGGRSEVAERMPEPEEAVPAVVLSHSHSKGNFRFPIYKFTTMHKLQPCRKSSARCLRIQ
jgi:hypothetical protein